MDQKTDKNFILQCEYEENPLGLDTLIPRFSWRGQGRLANKIQRSYQLFVTDGQNTIWNSGEIKSRKSHAVTYEGPSLQSSSRYYWSVLVKIEDEDQVFRSEEAWFETGLLNSSDWQDAVWLSHPSPKRGVSPLFRRNFFLNEIPDISRLYLSGLGYAKVYLNGHLLDGSLLDPGWTDYNKTVLYRTFALEKFLRKGENVLSFVLGEGWYGNDHAGFFKLIGKLPDWLDYPKLICLLKLDDEYIASKPDGKWLVSTGPILQNNIYDGMVYDARLEKGNWKLPEYSCDSSWLAAVEGKAPKGKLRSQQMPFIGKQRKLEPVKIFYTERPDPHEVVVDLGTNISGWAQVTAEGKPGQKITLKYAENLREDKTVNQDNLRNAKATDIFIIGHEGSITYEPDFTYHGFRYVQINTDPGVIITDVTGWQINSLLRRTSTFNCSNELLNNIYKAVIQTEQNNIHSVPTDCPQRDERLAWINDVTARSEESFYNFDAVKFYEKWLQDISDAQDLQTGSIPDTAPYFYGGSPAFHVSSAYVLIPWFLYSFYQDSKMISRHFSNLEKYISFKLTQRDERGVINKKYFGDWAAPMTECILGWGENAVPKNNPQELITTCYLYYDCILMEKMSKVLNLPEKVKKYQALQYEIKASINHTFFNTDHYAGNAQSSNVFPLFLDLVPEGKRKLVLDNFLEDLFDKRNGGLTTGNQMTKYLYEVLAMEDLNEKAYDLVTHKSYPSFNYMLEAGATTIWERWENMSGDHMNSHDHPMLGAFSTWFHKSLCGLDLFRRNDQGQLIIKPSYIKDLEYVKGSIEIPQGEISLEWRRIHGKIIINVEIPWNTKSLFSLPEYVSELIFDQSNIKIANDQMLILLPGKHKIEFTEENAAR